LTRQLANLANVTETSSVIHEYKHILEVLAHVRIGCILVEKDHLDALVDLVSTLLNSVRREHPSEIVSLIPQAVAASLWDYHPAQGGLPFPIPILDVLLKCIAQGPTQSILVPAAAKDDAASDPKKNKKKGRTNAGASALQTVQVSNPTYHAAAHVIRSSLNRIAQPISQLLNGLLNGEAFYTDQSSLRGLAAAADEEVPTPRKKSGTPTKGSALNDPPAEEEIYIIAYELHRVAPQILATVVGTLANGLRSASTPQRYAVTRFFGKLFSVGNYAIEYAPCFRDWLQRQHDICPKIRRGLIDSALAIWNAAASSSDATAVTPALAQLTAADPSIEVRTAALHAVCDALYQMKPTKPKEQVLPLLQAVASRVSSKQKQERRDAVTGLAHIYCQQYLQPHIQPVVKACLDDSDEDDVLSAALHVLQEVSESAAHLESSPVKQRSRKSHSHDRADDASPTEVYGWIPAKILECVCFTDAVDSEMRSRVISILDESLLSPSKASKDKKLLVTARAVAWTLAFSSVDPSSNAYKFLQQLLTQRATLQAVASRYIDARAQLRACPAGTEEALEADARARQLLEQVAHLSCPVENSKVSMESVISAFHGAKDQHIFRILATITDPSHSASARARALEELPKRTSHLGDAVSEWVKQLVKRCAMGDAMNAPVLQECVRLARGCVQEQDIASGAALLASVQMLVDIFPTIGTAAIFEELSSLFLQCRSVSGTLKKDLNRSGMVTRVTSILSLVAAAPSNEAQSPMEPSDELLEELMQLCTRDGSPEQARNAVYALARLAQRSSELSTASSLSEYLAPILQSLTISSTFKLSNDAKEGLQVIRALSSLSALVDCCPSVLATSKQGQYIFSFVLEVVLLGKEKTKRKVDSDDDDASNSDNESLDQSTSRKHQRSTSSPRKKNMTPNFKGSLLESETVSVPGRQLCAAVDFLVSYIRATTLLHVVQTSSKGKDGEETSAPPTNQMQLLFQSLVRVLQNQGLPLSARDQKCCSTRQDRAALRQCAAVSLLRLCDTRLGLEQEMLTKSMWHTLAMALLDEEKAVRVAVMEELSSFYKGTDAYGMYMTLPPKAPSLRFLSLVTMCCDGDRDHDASSSHSVSIARAASAAKAAASNCVVNLRKVAEATYTHCCAIGKEAEARFENRVKLLITPEYCVPFAYHLLSHRRDTPSEDAFTAFEGTAEENDDDMSDDHDHSVRVHDGQMRLLRKRLKVLFDSLVQTLGERANNISFLLRMTEIVGRHYIPVYVGITSMSEPSHSRKRQSTDSNGSSVALAPAKPSAEQTRLVEARLKTICSTAREILLSYVKSDVNLTTYPGTIQLPLSLFRRSDLGTIRISTFSDDNAESGKSTKSERAKSPLLHSPNTKASVSPRPTLKSSLGASRSLSASKSDVRVTFSPVVQYPEGKTTGKTSFGSASPKQQSDTPRSGSSGRRSIRSSSTGSSAARSVKTLGTTPPTDLPTGTAFEESDDEVMDTLKPQPSVWPKSVGNTSRSKSKTNEPPLTSSSATPNSETSVLVTQTSENSDLGPSPLSSRKSTQSSYEEEEDHVAVRHPRKRRTPVVEKAVAKKTKPTSEKPRSKSPPPPKHIHVTIPAPKRGKSSKVRGDDLDFPDDTENVTNARHAKKAKKAPPAKKSKVLTGRSF
jgi:hypothetical protein